MSRNLLFAALIALTLIGLGDSWYLASSASTETPLVCDIGAGLDGCNQVAESPYSKFLGIPLADFGLLFYGITLLATLLAWKFNGTWSRRLLLSVAFVGAAASVYFVTLQIFVIKAYCIYCLISAVVSWIILVLAAKVNGALTPRPLDVVS